MPQDIRGNFFSGATGGMPVERPPGALEDHELEDLCTGCGDCVAVCPQEVLVLDAQSLPAVVSKDRCGKCGLCADVCMMGAIELTVETRLALVQLKTCETETGHFAFAPLPETELA